MIISHIDDETGSVAINPFLPFRQAVQWVKDHRTDFPEGITMLQERSMYVNVHGYETRERLGCLWESHRHTVDIQFCIAGGELIDWGLGLPDSPSVRYNAEKDTDFWVSDTPVVQTLRMVPGLLVVFFPGELHRPMVIDGQYGAIKKLVVKIDASLVGAL